MKKKFKFCFLFYLLFILEYGFNQNKENTLDLNTALMLNTYKIVGKESIGTCFLIADYITDTTYKYILVTATHVLSGITGDSATLILRKKNGDIFRKMEYKIAIRSNSKNLYLNHQNSDVSVMYLTSFPDSAFLGPAIPEYLLADDDVFIRNNIHAGYEVRCLGFPLNFEANNAGFAILRSGNIASYPLYPSKNYPTFLLDVKIFKGNSGGPVYYSRDEFKNVVTYGKEGLKSLHYILGLVSQERVKTESKNTIYETETKVTQMDIAVVINSSYIKDMINILKSTK